jgi:hypothetical protein
LVLHCRIEDARDDYWVTVLHHDLMAAVTAAVMAAVYAIRWVQNSFVERKLTEQNGVAVCATSVLLET